MWKKFEQFHLTENMRLIGSGTEEVNYASYLLEIGNGVEAEKEGRESCDSSAEIKVPIPTQLMSAAKNVSEFCDEIYPNMKNIVSTGLQSEDKSWHEWLTERSIICPTNCNVSDINELLIHKFPGEMQTYKSFDRCATKDQVNILHIYVSNKRFLLNRNSFPAAQFSGGAA